MENGLKPRVSSESIVAACEGLGISEIRLLKYSVNGAVFKRFAHCSLLVSGFGVGSGKGLAVIRALNQISYGYIRGRWRKILELRHELTIGGCFYETTQTVSLKLLLKI